MAETKRAVIRADVRRELDSASDQMAEILRRADALLVEWSEFGTAVRTQVEREANRIGDVVGEAVETAAHRATASAIDRAIADRLGSQLAALSAEVSKLESRAKAASRAVSEQRRTDRGILIGLVVAVVLANGLLIALLLRGSATPTVTLAPEPVPVAPVRSTALEVTPAPELPPTLVHEPIDRPPTPAPASGEALKPNDGPLKAIVEPARPESRKPIKQGPPSGSRRP